MITQYTNSSGYSSADSIVQATVANKISLLDQYMLMQTGEYEYTALVRNPFTKKTTQYKFSRNYNYGSAYNLNVTEGVPWDYTVTNEVYVFSNMGQGRSLDLPVYEGVLSYSLIIICCTLLFAIVYKGVLFKCLDRAKRR